MGGAKTSRGLQIKQHFRKIWYLILAEIAKKGIFFTFFVLVPNCPVPNCPGAKLSWCKIVLVTSCPLLLSWCQIVPFIFLVPNCPVPNCPVPNCPVPNCPTIKIRYHIFHFKHIHPQNEKQKKTIFHFNENSNRFQSQVYISMYMFEIE